MSATQMITSPITFILTIGVSLYVARWLWKLGDKTSAIEGKEDAK